MYSVKGIDILTWYSVQDVEIPFSGEILGVGVVNYSLQLWIKYDLNGGNKLRTIRLHVVKAYPQALPELQYKYLGTVVLGSSGPVHVFLELEE